MSVARVFQLVAWSVLLVIALTTMVPAGLRPESGLPTQIERLVAFAVLGFLFVLAYPRHVIIIGVAMLAIAIGLEALQLLIPSRHSSLSDLAVKLAGGGAGIAAGRLASYYFGKLVSIGQRRD